MRLLPTVASCVAAACAVLATPALSRAAGRDTVALVVMAKDDPSPAMVKAFGEAFVEAAQQLGNVQILAGKQLDQRLKGDAGAAVTTCGANLKCLAKLGSKAKASRLIMARVVGATSGAIAVQVLVVGTKSKAIERKGALDLANLDEVRWKLPTEAFQLIGATGKSRLAVSGPAGEIKVDGKLVGKGPGHHEVAPGRHRVQSGSFDTEVLVAPGRAVQVKVPPGAAAASQETPEADPLALVAPPPKASPDEPPPPAKPAPPPIDDLELVSLSPNSGTSAATSPPPSSPPPTEVVASAPPPALMTQQEVEQHASTGPTAWWYLGVASAGTGAALLSGGGYFGWHASSLRGDVRRGAGGTTQVDAQRTFNRANNDASRANLMFIVGSVLLTAGGALLGWEYLGASQPSPLAANP